MNFTRFAIVLCTALLALPAAPAFATAGNVYISDSFQATIWRTSKSGGAPTPWVPANPLLGNDTIDAADNLWVAANRPTKSSSSIPRAASSRSLATSTVSIGTVRRWACCFRRASCG